LYADVKELAVGLAHGGLKPYRFLRTGDKIQNVFIRMFSSAKHGPDRTRTYDPALIKRML